MPLKELVKITAREGKTGNEHSLETGGLSHLVNRLRWIDLVSTIVDAFSTSFHPLPVIDLHLSCSEWTFSLAGFPKCWLDTQIKRQSSSVFWTTCSDVKQMNLHCTVAKAIPNPFLSTVPAWKWMLEGLNTWRSHQSPSLLLMKIIPSFFPVISAFLLHGTCE